MAVVASGAILLPGCRTETWPTYSNIPLEPDQHRLMAWLTEAILPKAGHPEITAPESTQHFVLTMINDCSAPEDIERYQQGLQAFQQYVVDKLGTGYKDVPPEKNILFFNEAVNSEDTPEELKNFINTTKRLSVRHFTGTEYFMTNIMDWEFVPGRFLGCVPLENAG